MHDIRFYFIILYISILIHNQQMCLMSCLLILVSDNVQCTITVHK